MKNVLLAGAISGLFAAAAEGEGGALATVAKEGEVETKPEQDAAMDAALEAAKEKGAQAADEVVKEILRREEWMLGLCATVAHIDTHDKCESFIEGIADRLEYIQKRGKASEKLAAKTAESMISRLNRVKRAVWGVGYGGKGAKPGIGLKETMKILNAKGGIHDKLKLLPSSGEGRKPKGAEQQVIARSGVKEGEQVVPSMGTLQKMLAVKPQKTDDAGKVAKAVESGLAITIKAIPESMLPIALGALLNRMRSSPEEFWQKLGQTFADHWTKEAAGEVTHIGSFKPEPVAAPQREASPAAAEVK